MDQIITGQAWEQHCLEYYDGKPKQGEKDQGAKMASGQPVLKKGILKSESVKRGKDFSVANELFGPMWEISRVC